MLTTAGGAALAQARTAAVDGDGSWRLTLPAGTANPLPDGTYRVTADVSDQAGNPAVQAVRTLTVDATAPATPTVVLGNDTGVSATDRLTRDGSLATTSEVGTTLLYALDGGAFGSAVPAFPQDDSRDGAHTVQVRAVDAAGNTTDGATLAFTLDTVADGGTAATLVVDATANGIIDLYEARQVRFALSGLDADAAAKLSVTDGTHAASASVGQDGALTLDVTGFDGMLASSLALADRAGNVASVAGNPVTIDVDAFLPLFGTVVHDASGPGGQVFEFYEGLLGRAPDASGFEYWQEALAHGSTLGQVAAGFLLSPEYESAHGPELG